MHVHFGGGYDICSEKRGGGGASHSGLKIQTVLHPQGHLQVQGCFLCPLAIQSPFLKRLAWELRNIPGT